MAKTPKKPTKASDLGAQVIEPSIRTYTQLQWTPALIKAAEVSADNGNLRLAANLCDWLLGDDRIQGTLQTRVQSLLGLDPTFEASGDKRRSKRTIRALEADEDWWDSYPESELANIMTWGLLLGVGPAAHSWTKRDDHGGRVLALPSFWHPQNLRWDWNLRSWVMLVGSPDTGMAVGTEVEIEPGDGTWILHAPYGKTRPWSHGLWRGLARLALLKAYAQTDWARLGEAASRTVVESDQSITDTKENRAELAQDISNIGRDGTIVLPPGYSYKLIEASAATKDIFDRQIEMANTAIAIAIRGGNLSTEVGNGGSKAAAQSQADTGEDPKMRFDAQTLTTTIHDQSLIWWAEFNFGDRGLAPWPVYPVKPKEDLKAKSDTLNVVSTALDRMLSNRLPVDIVAFCEQYDIPLRSLPPEQLTAGTAMFQYHLDYGVVTHNQVLASLGLPPVKGGDERLIPSASLVAPAPAKPPAPPAPPADVAKNPDGTPVSPAAPPFPPKPVARRVLAAADQPKGFVEGQGYADDLGDTSRDHGSDAMAPSVDDVLAVVKAATSFDDMKARLTRAYDSMGAEKMTELVEKAVVLAELAGRYAVLKDL